MNKRVHRLVFDRRRGMRVPAAEHVRTAGKAAGGQQSAVALTMSGLLVAMSAAMPAEDAAAQSRSIGATMTRSANFAARVPGNALPVRSAQGSVQRAADRGNFTVRDTVVKPDGTTYLQVDQLDKKVVINWGSFNIGLDGHVHYNQVVGGSALNKIHDQDPSLIFGKLSATGEVILQNNNGFIFGRNARVDAGRFVATALAVADSAFERGIRNVTNASAAFENNEADSSGYITIERGAEIKALAGGDVMMIAPKVFNEGRIETPQGQTILAAGKSVYLFTPEDATQRGLVVAVDPFAAGPAGVNTVEQAQAGGYKTVNGQTVADDTSDDTAGLERKINAVVAEKGAINLVGLSIRQNGVLSATNAVKSPSGAIFLHAMKSTRDGEIDPALQATSVRPRVASELGDVHVGAASITQVLPHQTEYTVDPTTKAIKAVAQLDAETFNKATIEIFGKDVRIGAGAQVVAPSGNVTLLAATAFGEGFGHLQEGFKVGVNAWDALPLTSPNARSASLLIDSGANISVAGVRGVSLSMSRNQLQGRLFASELADSPVQRGGVLYRQEVFGDARQLVRVANVTGFYNSIERDAQELSTKGGALTINSQGSLIADEGATLDVSGGSVRYEDGKIKTTLLKKGNAIVSLEDALPGVKYDAIITPAEGSGQSIAAYDEGKDAGRLRINANDKLALAAQLKGDVVTGPRQRAGATTVAPASLLSNPYLYASKRAKAGTFELGYAQQTLSSTTDYSVNQLDIRADLSSSLREALGRVREANPLDNQALNVAWGASDGMTELPAMALNQGGFGSVTLIAGNVKSQADAVLTLGPSGEFLVKGAKVVDLAGQIQAPGGTVAINTVRIERSGGSSLDGSVTLRESAVIDVRGSRLDERGETAASNTPVAVNGGSVKLEAQGSIDLQTGSAIDVSAGVWINNVGSTTQGTAGSLSLTVKGYGSTTLFEVPPGTLTMNGNIQGFGFSKGGSLSISGVRTLSLGGVADDNGLSLDTSFFSDHGFGSFDLSAQGNVSVADNFQLQPVLRNLQVQASRRPENGTPQLAVVELPLALRQSMSLALDAKSTPTTVLTTPVAQGASLNVGKGASIDMGAGGSISLKAGRQIKVEGALRAQGGQISLALSGARGSTDPTSPNDNAGYIADQQIHLTMSARLDVSGVARILARPSGALSGDVLAGGVVNLNTRSQGSASRGYVVVDDGAVIDVSGAAADISLGRGVTTTRVSKGAGAVNVASAEGFSLAGNLVANRPDASVSGGLFTATISRQAEGAFTTGQAYPTGERVIQVIDSTSDVASQALKPGVGAVSSQELLNSGFDRIRLTSEQRIDLGAGVSLIQNDPQQPVLREVQLNTRVISASDGQPHQIKAHYVALGDRDLKGLALPQGNAQPPQPTLGAASLSVTAGLIDVLGYSAFQGVGNVDLAATLSPQGDNSRRDGEIRLVGKAYLDTSGSPRNSLDGGLTFAGNLNLTAGQIYTTTLSNFALKGVVQGGVADHLQTYLPGAGSTSAQPLSALGTLNIQASLVDHGGIIRQPFGAITLTSTQSTQLLGGSELSVTGANLVVPVGTTVNGSTWYYNTAGTSGTTASDSSSSVLASGNQLTLPVTKQIVVDGLALTIDSQATLNAQAGGNLQAWEFIKGVGGTTDTLARKDAFAVLPSYNYDFAPHDTEVLASTKANGTTLQAGDQIEIQEDNQVLAKGRYTLLPLRYALMPGAVVVSAATLASSNSPSVTLDDGTVRVKGVRTAAGTSQTGGTPLSALLLEPQATVQAKSRIDKTGMNDFLQAQAERIDSSRGNLAGDAGRVSLRGLSAFDWAAKLDLRGATGFLAGELDLSMPRILVTNANESAPQGWSNVSADALTFSGARSILLGGMRTGDSSNVTVSTQSTQVEVAANTQVAAGEWVLAARDQLQVGDGAALTANGSDDGRTTTFSFLGQGASVVVSSREQVSVRRDTSQGGASEGDLTIGAANLTGGAVQVDATGAMLLSTDQVTAAKTLGFGAQRLSVGGDSGATGAVVVEGALLDSLKGATRLQLRGFAGIDMMGSVALDARGNDGLPLMRELTIDTAALRGVGTSEDTVSLVAQDIALLNSGGITAQAAVPGSGISSLSIEATPPVRGTRTGGLTLGQEGESGDVQLGFASTNLTSKGDVVLAGKGDLIAQGDLTVSGARMTATTGAQRTVQSTQALTLATASGARTLGERVGTGANIAFMGQTVAQNGKIDLPSGHMLLQATGTGAEALTIAQGSQINAGGFAVKVSESNTLYAQGGSVSLSSAGGIQLNGAIDVSAGQGNGSQAYAGTLSVSAAKALNLGEQALIQGKAAQDNYSGVLRVDAQSLQSQRVAAVDAGTLDALVDMAREGGFHREVALRMRQGDQSLNTALKAQTVNVAADDGSLTLKPNAVINADAPQGGLVSLYASRDLQMAAAQNAQAARILARSIRAGANGGDVLLASREGVVRLAAGTEVDASGDDAQDGRVLLRATLAADPKLNIELNNPTIKAAEVVAEAVRVYEGNTLGQGVSNEATGFIGHDTILNDAQALAAAKDTLLADAGIADLPLGQALRLRLGAEMQSTGDFTVGDDWHLWAEERAGQEPLMLTVRAAGNLNVNASLTDGMGAELAPGVNEIKSDLGASFRLVAGADLTSSNLLATQTLGMDSTSGNLTLAPSVKIRTSSGSIELAAASDIEFKSDPFLVGQQAAVMVTGRRSNEYRVDEAFFVDADGVTQPNFDHRFYLNEELSPEAQFTSHGGRLSLVAGRDMVEPAVSQFFSNWFRHIGGDQKKTAWWSGVDGFRMGLASFGGGNINLQAGRDMVNVSAASATSGRALVKLTPSADDTVLDGFVVENGGDVAVSAGRDIRGGMFMLGRGEGLIQANGAITAGSALSNTTGQAPVLALSDGHWTMQATRDLSLNTVVNPTILGLITNGSPETNLLDAAWYYTYSPDSRAHISSAGGLLSWAPTNSVVGVAANTEFDNKNEGQAMPEGAFSVLPAQVSAVAFGGDVSLNLSTADKELTLFPTLMGTSTGDTQLQIYAQQNLRLASESTGTLVLPGSDRSLAASVDSPVVPVSNLPGSAVIGVSGSALSGSNSKALLAAGGDIQVDKLNVSIQKPAEILAGGNITNLAFSGQHYNNTDTTRIQAGGSVLGTAASSVELPPLATLGGPGELQVLAGRQLDLGVSGGITTTGNNVTSGFAVLEDPTSAHIVMGAGLNKQVVLDEFVAYLGLPGSSAVLNNFVQTVLQPSAQENSNAQAMLVSVVKDQLKLTDADLEAKGGTVLQGALAYFKLMPTQQQVDFADGLQNQLFARQFVTRAGSVYARGWFELATLLNVSPTDYNSDAFAAFKRDVLYAELSRLGSAAVDIADSTNARVNAEAKTKRQGLYDEAFGVISLAGLGEGASFKGDITLENSKVLSSGTGSLSTGGADLLAPGGRMVVGLESGSGSKGIVMGQGGDIRALSSGDFLVGSGKVFAVGLGEVFAWSSDGSIDNGVGSNTSVSVPAITLARNADGSVKRVTPALTTGSGVGVIEVVGDDGKPVCTDCKVELYAPNGEVRALDTYIRSPGGITLGAKGVKGADNLKGDVKGASVVATAGPSTSIRAPQSTDSASSNEEAKAAKNKAKDPNSILTVDVLSMGDGGDAGAAPGAGTKPPCKSGKYDKNGMCEE